MVVIRRVKYCQKTVGKAAHFRVYHVGGYITIVNISGHTLLWCLEALLLVLQTIGEVKDLYISLNLYLDAVPVTYRVPRKDWGLENVIAHLLLPG